MAVDLKATTASDELEQRSAQDVVAWAAQLGSALSLASSFGAEDVVLIDMLVNVGQNGVRIFTLDTGRLNQETYDVMDRIRKKYSIDIEAYAPDTARVESMVRDLVARSIAMVEEEERETLILKIREEVKEAVLDKIIPPPRDFKDGKSDGNGSQTATISRSGGTGSSRTRPVKNASPALVALSSA